MSLFFLCLPLRAALTGDLRGTVFDPQGLPVSDATVTVRNAGTGESRTLPTGLSGYFAFLQLDVGTYHLSVEKQGFRTASTDVEVRSGEADQADIRLEIGASTETVTVQAAGTQLDATSSQVSTSLSTQEVRDLPRLDRTDPVAFATLSPGTVPVTNDNPNVNSGNFNANGQRGRANNITVDNSVATDIALTGWAAKHTFSVDSIQEIEVITNDFAAEFGRNAGSQVQIITRAGTNDYHGAVYWYGQNSAFNARDYFDTTGKATPFIQNQWGFWAGGHILKDRLFALGQYEGLKDRGQGDTVVATVLTPSQMAAITDPTSQALFQAEGAPTSPTGHLTNAAPNRTDSYLWSLRVDGTFHGGKDLLTSRYGEDPITAVSPSLTFFGTNLPNYGAQGKEADRTFNLGLTHVFMENVVNQVRVQYERSNPSFQPFTNLSQPYAPLVRILGGFDIMGVSASFPQNRVQNVFVYSDSLSWVTGRHAFKFGADVYRYELNSVFPANARGAFTFASLSNFQDGIPLSYSQFIGSPARGFRDTDAAFYAQDDIRVAPTLILNIGLRMESSGGTSEVHNVLANLDRGNSAPLGGAGSGPLGSIDIGGHAFQRNTNWAPRLGGAWNPNRGKLVVRGGYGWIYDYLFLNPIVNLEQVAPFATTVTLTGAAISGADSYSNLVANTAASQMSARAGLGTFSPAQVNFGSILPVQQDLRNPRTEEWDAGVEYQLPRDFVVKATYIGNSVNYLQVSMPINLIPAQNRPAPATSLADEVARQSAFFQTFSFENGTANGSVVNNRLDHRFNAVTQLQSAGKSAYDSLQVELLKRLGNLTLDGSYTYGNARDDVSDSLPVVINDSAQIQDPRNLASNWGPADFDVRHRVVASAIFTIPWTRSFTGKTGKFLDGWALSGIFSAQSGFPATIFSGNVLGITDVAMLGGGTERANGSPAGFQPAPFGGAGAAAIPAPCARGVNAIATLTPCTDTSGFPLTQPLLGTLGTSGRNQLRLDGINDLDLALFKNTRVTERLTAQVRWEVYNVLNVPNFGGFVNTLTSSTFGTYTATATSQRKMQLAVKFLF